MIYTHADGDRTVSLVYGNQEFKKKDRVVFSIDGSHYALPMGAVAQECARNGILFLLERMRKKKKFSFFSLARLRALVAEAREKRRGVIAVGAFNNAAPILIPTATAARWVESIAAHEMRR